MGAINKYNGANIAVFPKPSYVNARALAAGVAESISVPSGANMVFLNTTAHTYVNMGGTAAVPTDLDDGSASALLSDGGQAYYLDGVTTISVISAGTPIVTATFYKN